MSNPDLSIGPNTIDQLAPISALGEGWVVVGVRGSANPPYLIACKKGHPNEDYYFELPEALAIYLNKHWNISVMEHKVKQYKENAARTHAAMLDHAMNLDVR